jgi:hypothetical protein
MKTQILRLTCIAAVMLSTPAWATLQIEFEEGCAIGVNDLSPEPDCPDNAACRNRGQTVHWQADRTFSLNFGGAESSIFEGWGQGNCQSNSNPGGQLSCRIAENAPKGGYDYDVKTDSCAMDPRLIIR